MSASCVHYVALDLLIILQFQTVFGIHVVSVSILALIFDFHLKVAAE